MRDLRPLVAVAATVLLLAGCTAAAPADPTGIDDLRTSEEDLGLLADCLRDRGWDAELEYGAITVEVPPEQKTVYEADNLECLEEVGIDTGASLSESDYESIYAWHVEIAECLAGAGLPTPDVPSYEVFRSTYDTDPWIPWSQVEGPDYGRAVDACPMLNGYS